MFMQLRTVCISSIALCVVAAGTLLSANLLVLWDRPSDSDRKGARHGSAWSPSSVDGAIIVEATGHKYFWRFRFAGPDGKFGTDDDVRVEDEIHLPLGREITFLITSDDYIYTMAIPKLELRQIAIPDLTYSLNFQTTATGEFDVNADALCKVRYFHDEYMGRVVVQPESAFDSWYKEVQ